jgi:hypothetical protein
MAILWLLDTLATWCLYFNLSTATMQSQSVNTSINWISFTTPMFFQWNSLKCVKNNLIRFLHSQTHSSNKDISLSDVRIRNTIGLVCFGQSFWIHWIIALWFSLLVLTPCIQLQDGFIGMLPILQLPQFKIYRTFVETLNTFRSLPQTIVHLCKWSFHSFYSMNVLDTICFILTCGACTGLTCLWTNDASTSFKWNDSTNLCFLR